MSGDPCVLEKVQEQLAQKEAKEQQLTAEWNEKWREAAKILQEHNALGLKRTGLGVVLDSDKPHLIGRFHTLQYIPYRFSIISKYSLSVCTCIFTCLDPDAYSQYGSRSTKLLNTDPQHWVGRITGRCLKE